MRAALLIALAALGCTRSNDMTSVRSEVQAYAQLVAREVTRDGPAAWRRHLLDTPDFFMVVNGELVFTSGAAASSAIDELVHTIATVELEWGDVRVDPLSSDLAVIAAHYRERRVGKDDKRVDENGFFTAIAQRRDGRWWIRDAHWSVPVPTVDAP